MICSRLRLVFGRFFRTISHCVWCALISIACNFSRTKKKNICEKNFKILNNKESNKELCGAITDNILKRAEG